MFSFASPLRPVWPWLTGVLANLAKKHQRRAGRERELEPVLAAAEDASRPLERRELDGEVARAIDALEEPYREVVLLRLRHALEPADIAHVLQRDAGTVRVQLHRGLEKLRASLPASLVGGLGLAWLAPRGLAAVRGEVVAAASARPCSWRTSPSTTRAPSATKRRAIAAPAPRAAPVITATLPSSTPMSSPRAARTVVRRATCGGRRRGRSPRVGALSELAVQGREFAATELDET